MRTGAVWPLQRGPSAAPCTAGAVHGPDGLPPAMCIEPGNTAETSTLKPMEQILKDKFGLSDIRCDTLQQHHSQNTSASTLLLLRARPR